MRQLQAGLLGLVAVGAAIVPAAAIEIDLPGEENRIEAQFTCESGTRLDVEFINVGENSLAVIRIDGGSPLVFANVVSANGARYVHGIYEFWDVGREATFTEAGSDAVNCKSE